MARALEFSEWAKRNARLVIAGSVIVAAVVIGLVYYYRFYLPAREARASVALMQVEGVAASGNAALAERDLRAFIRRFDGTIEADQGRLMLARIQLEGGKAREAVAVLQSVDQDADTPVGAQGDLLLAAAQAQSGARDAAIRTYLELGENADIAYFREEALAGAALLRQQGGDFAGAAELYGRLAELSEEGSLQRSVFEMRMAEAEGRARAQ
jgi:predicted negative regulator of RcsB-dependent stress response